MRQKFLKSGVEAKVYSIGRTLYLDMELDDLVSQDQEKAYRAMMNMQSGLSLITRVALSSDAGIKYMVVSALTLIGQFFFVQFQVLMM